MRKQLESVRFHCTVAGYLWWEGLATKELDVTFTPIVRAFTRRWTNLEDALDYLMLHGSTDFRNEPAIVNCIMEITWRAGKDYITRYAALPVGKLTAPYWADDEMIEESYCIESED